MLKSILIDRKCLEIIFRSYLFALFAQHARYIVIDMLYNRKLHICDTWQFGSCDILFVYSTNGKLIRSVQLHLIEREFVL